MHLLTGFRALLRTKWLPSLCTGRGLGDIKVTYTETAWTPVTWFH